MPQCVLELIVDNEAQEARAQVLEARADTADEDITSAEGLMEALKSKNVVYGIDQEAIDALFARLPEIETPGETVVVARGKKPIHGENGYIDFKVDVSGVSAYRGDEEADENNNIDFKSATNIVSAEPGMVIANIIKPTNGENGITLAGKELSARDGKPVSLRTGDGVEVDEEAGTIKAEKFGRPLYRGGVVSVNPLYEVEGDVDYSTGNVSFKGHVLVRGNVLDDFSVTADSIEIQGVVGACEIKAACDLSIAGGINGRDKAVITAGGNAKVKYVNQAKITVDEDLLVAREVVNSIVWCRGKVKAGKILGGDCIALHGIEAKILGSELGVMTTLEPGANYEVRRLDEAMEEIAGKIEKIIKPIEQFFGDRNRFKALPEEKREEYAEAYKTFAKLKELHDKLSGERRAILDHEKSQPVKQVIVHQKVYPDVFMRTDLCMRQFKTEVTGPAALVEDVARSTIRAANYNPGRGIIEDDEDDD